MLSARWGGVSMTTTGVQTDLLSSVLLAISRRLNHHSFDTWFKPVSRATRDSSTLYLTVPNEIFRDWISTNYFDVIEESLEELHMAGFKVEFLLDDSPGQTALRPQTSPESPQGLDRAGGSSRSPQSLTPGQVIPEQSDLPLNPKYKFETFVVGSCNQFAHAASLAVVDMPAKTYNPFYIYGGVGLGKTHLMHAIGYAIKTRNQALRLTYISSERFMNELINAIRYDQTIKFRDRYRNIDVLLIDDIQFLAGKERTQEEFFHTFNALYDSQKQIIISSDCPPREIPTLEERLHSRFEWGLIADIQPPDLETKVAILKRKAELERIDLPDDVAIFIASKIKSNIRELEGSLVRLLAYASLKALPIDIDLAKQVLKNIIDSESDAPSIELIQRIVAGNYRLKPVDLRSKSNRRVIAFPRQIAMYLCKVLTSASLPEIGREFGGKHHSTVLHSINKIANLRDSDPVFHSVIDNLIASMK
jgi:chromosomal replication initiator protein